MRQSEVTPETVVYLTRVSGELVPVRVVCQTTQVRDGYRKYYRHGGTINRTVFRVRRCDNGQILPKPRTAAALRPLPA